MLKQQRKKCTPMDRIVKIFKASDCEVRPHFILTGPSGSGKSHMVRALCDANKIDYFEVNAAQLTKEGTAGNSLSKALTPLTECRGRPVICFVDEFDKLFISNNYNTSMANEITNGVQNEFLKVLEGPTTSIFGDYGKYITVNCSNVLFVFAGAFNGEEDIGIDRLRELGLKTEFLGRVSLTFSLDKLSIESMRTVLVTSQLLETYLGLIDGFDYEKAVEVIMFHIEKVHEKNTLGIRLIDTLIHQYFINNGKLPDNEVEKVTFQKKIKLFEE